MIYVPVVANDVEFEIYEGDVDEEGRYSGVGSEACVPIFLIGHEEPMMLTREVLESHVGRWTASLLSEERPVTAGVHFDAMDAFVQWLVAQPFGYVAPQVTDNLVILPIFEKSIT